MSHFSRIKTRIQDKELLLESLRNLGYEIRESSQVRGHTGTRSADFVVEIPGGYNIGFCRDSDGAYEIVADWWGVSGTGSSDFKSRVESAVQQAEDELRRQALEVERGIRREYAEKKALASLHGQGFKVVDRAVAEDGSITFVAQRWR